MTHLSRFGIAAALLTLVVFPKGTLAQTQVFDFTGGGSASAFDAQTLGYSFSLSTTMNLTDLGIFDLRNNGLINSHQVGLWTSTGTLLASTTVAAGGSPVLPGDPNGVISGSGAGAFRYNSVISQNVVLTPGNYVVGAGYIAGDADGVFAFGTSPVMAPNFTYVDARYITGTFVFPNGVVGAPYPGFGPNLRVTTVTPELPGSVLLVPALLPVALTAMRRRRSKTRA